MLGKLLWAGSAIIGKLRLRRFNALTGAAAFDREKAEPMAQHLSERQVRDIAEYARIGLDDGEVTQMTADLNAIIESLSPILEYDLEGVEPTFHPIGGLVNVMRDDVETTGFTQQEALANAPKQQDGCFLIPSILGEGGDR
ncbi:Asp-tRNA(Asn)/Glu-tRNA(Gln) amidotransferase subunit GatC [Adlercreutzia sp. ZJ138]|uniref:Asp-tRNA(Asn)/Glu-tRNA(Gln) amidotransferase subunit GatC n=2 Tax=unclassified Adlercreutzia TaxID=2636013 RepID=UPI001F14E2B9|nr:Asp-tRNA(Asn)/Glu-tRNA(Gln) amidotransferase subunit GatC [Adlercreutzia sp. ZJ138]